MKIYISVNKYSEGFMDIRDDNDNILYQSAFGFELPYDIAENIAYALSFGAHVELEDENYNKTVYKNGKVVI